MFCLFQIEKWQEYQHPYEVSRSVEAFIVKFRGTVAQGCDAVSSDPEDLLLQDIDS